MEQERRSVIRWLLGGGFAASIASFLYPAVKFIDPPDMPEAAVNEVSGGKTQDLKPNSREDRQVRQPARVAGARERHRMARLLRRLPPSELHRAI